MTPYSKSVNYTSTMSEKSVSILKKTGEVVGHTLLGGLSVPATAIPLSWFTYLEIWRLNEVTNNLAIPNIDATHDWRNFLESQVLEPLTTPSNYQFDAHDKPYNDPGNRATWYFALHAYSASLSLANERHNANPIVSIPATIEYWQKQLDNISKELLPTWAHTILKLLSSNLGFAAPTLLALLPNPLEIYDATMMEPYHFVPLLKETLHLLWGLGTATLINDYLRVGANIILWHQRYYAKHNTDVYQAILDSFLAPYEREYHNLDKVKIEALVAAGITKRLLPYLKDTPADTEYLRQAASKLQVAFDSLNGKRFYTEDIGKYKERITKAAKPWANALKRTSRKYHDVGK